MTINLLRMRKNLLESLYRCFGDRLFLPFLDLPKWNDLTIETKDYVFYDDSLRWCQNHVKKKKIGQTCFDLSIKLMSFVLLLVGSEHQPT